MLDENGAGEEQETEDCAEVPNTQAATSTTTATRQSPALWRLIVFCLGETKVEKGGCVSVL